MISVKLDFIETSKDIKLDQFLASNDNTYNGCKFFVNSDIIEADYWFVIDDLNNMSSCFINPDKTYFLTAENFLPKGYYCNKTTFLNQFGKIYSCHDIFLNNVTFDLPFLPWMIYSGYHVNMFDKNRKYEEIAFLNPIKTKTLSVFCSNKSTNEHHGLRLRFVTKLKEYFKDKLDWFGNGINPIDLKNKAINPYKYHLALENFSANNIITEKLYDSYLGLAYPIYYGAPNVSDYFPENSLSQINIADLQGSIKIIEQAIENNLYEKHLSEIKKAKELALNEYNIFKRIANIATNDAKNNNYLANKQQITLYPIQKANKILNIGGKIVRKVGQKIIDFSLKS